MNGSPEEKISQNTKAAVDEVIRDATYSADIASTEKALVGMKEKCESPDAIIFLARAKAAAGFNNEGIPLLQEDLAQALHLVDNALAVETAGEIIDFRDRIMYAQKQIEEERELVTKRKA